MSLLKRIILLAALAGIFMLGSGNVVRAAEEPAARTGQTHTTAEEETKEPLIPDLASGATWAQALWTVIIFVFLVSILYPTAWKNVLAGLKKREEGIRADIAQAEAARKGAEETLKQYNEQLATAEGKIRDMMARASADAEKLATSLRMQAQQESEEIKERANREIDAARKAALNDIYAQAAEISTSIASKILRRNLNPDDQRELVSQSLNQLQSAGKV